MYKNLVLPASLLAGTIIGAGIFALPFVFMKAGIIAGLFYLIVFCLVFILIHLMYAEVIIKTDGDHNFPGYVRVYLGRRGFWLANLTSILGLFLILLIYLVLSLSFLNLILPAGSGISDIFKIMFFWLIGSAAIFLATKRLVFSEFLTTSGIVLIALLLFVLGIFNFDKIISIRTFNLKNIFLPYGVILFSLMGRVAIPSVIRYFKKIGQPVAGAKKAIILGTSIPAFVYLLFVFGILGLSGSVSEDAVSGLINSVNPIILVLVGVFGFISVLDSYNVVGLDIKNSLSLDLKFSRFWAGSIVVILPLLLFWLGLSNFLELAGIIGGVFIALEGILIGLMYLKLPDKKFSPILPYILILVFIGGIVYKLVY